MTDTVTASDGTALPIASLPVTITWDGSFVDTMTVSYTSNQYGVVKDFVTTYTNDGTNITAISDWVVQP